MKFEKTNRRQYVGAFHPSGAVRENWSDAGVRHIVVIKQPVCDQGHPRRDGGTTWPKPATTKWLAPAAVRTDLHRIRALGFTPEWIDTAVGKRKNSH